ncbi:hypothetical protein HK096_005268 [Nowakowskiella sp. JEL0078]|nr:hypothetical protein HK096_005268 [Nowakowskiella sp. JEL0078]
MSLETRKCQLERYVPLSQNSSSATSTLKDVDDDSEEEYTGFGVSERDAASWTRLNYVLFAAILHFLANAIVTIYGVTYPVYVYFLYLNSLAEYSNIPNAALVWPKISHMEHVGILSGSVVAAILVVVVGILIPS